MLPSLHLKLAAIHRIHWGQVRTKKSLFLCCLCHLELDRDAVVQCAEPSMGPITALLINWLIHTIVSHCDQEAQRLWGLKDDGTVWGQDSLTATSP